MNLSKKTIKHILRILDNKCIEVPTKTSAYSNGGRRILTRDFEPKESHGLNDWQRIVYVPSETSVYKGYKQDKIEMRGDRAEMSDFPLYLNTVAGGLDRRDQTIGGFSFVVKIYAVPVVEIIG